MSDSSSSVACDIDVTPGIEVGTYANAIRIVADTGSDLFVDFLVYSSSERKARVVGRMRIHESLLVPIRDRFEIAVQDVENRRQSSVPTRGLSIVPFQRPEKSIPDPATPPDPVGPEPAV